MCLTRHVLHPVVVRKPFDRLFRCFFGFGASLAELPDCEGDGSMVRRLEVFRGYASSQDMKGLETRAYTGYMRSPQPFLRLAMPPSTMSKDDKIEPDWADIARIPVSSVPS